MQFVETWTWYRREAGKLGDKTLQMHMPCYAMGNCDFERKKGKHAGNTLQERSKNTEHMKSEQYEYGCGVMW